MTTNGKTDDAAVRTEKERRPGGPDIVGALILLTLGVLFLLNNFGVLPWSIWGTLWRFWPVLLILPGFQLLFGRSAAGRILSGLIAFLLLGGVALYAASLNHQPVRGWVERQFPSVELRSPDELGAQATTSLRVPASDYPSVNERTLSADVGAAELTLRDDAANTSLLELEAQHPEGSGKPTVRDRLEGKRVILDVATERGNAPFILGGKRAYALLLGQPTLPTTLKLTLGAGKADVQLNVVPVQEFALDLGAGNAELSFAGNSVPTRLAVDVGAGQATIRVPRAAALRVRHDIGAGRLTVDGERLSRNGQYVIEGSGPTVELTVDIGAGSVVIERT